MIIDKLNRSVKLYKVMNRSKQDGNLRQNESGIVSIVSALILMIILSIIVLSFAQVSRTEAKDALNRQLSTEAYYSAESGVNDAYSIISADINHQPQIAPVGQTACNTGSYTSGTSYILNQSSNTEYTCLLVNPYPQELVQKSLPNSSSIFNINTVDPTNSDAPTGAGFLSLQFSIYNQQYQASCPNENESVSPTYFTPNIGADWPALCPPVVEVSLANISAAEGGGSTFTEPSLLSNTKTFYLYPETSPSSPDSTSNLQPAQYFSNIKNGDVYGALCTPSTCEFTIDYTNPANPSTTNPASLPDSQMAKINDFYGSNQMQYKLFASKFCASGCPGFQGNPLDFEGDQIQIDSTGRAQTELRRVQVVTSLTPTPTLTPPDYAIQTDDTLCKRLQIQNNSGTYSVTENIPGLAPTDPNLLGAGSYNIDTNPNPSLLPGTNESNTDSCDPYFSG